MRSRVTAVAGVSVAALAIAACFAPGASANRAPSASHVSTSHGATFQPTKLGTCIDQSDNDNGVGIVSQNFEAANDAFDSRGADDFKLKKTCQVKMVMVYGTYFNGTGPAASENVTFYRDMAGVPGGVISNQKNLTGEDDGLGNFTIDLKSPVGLRAGKYWVSVQINMDFGVGGEWGWNTNNKQRGNPGVWRNKGDGFATGCIHYTALTTCIDAGEGPDWAYMLHGS
jgi:hypothetical protein